VLGEVLRALSEPKVSLAEARTKTSASPGLYAIHGGPGEWKDLGLGIPADNRPLYVAKSESSLISRDVHTHFGDGRTGQSTARRSFAALLRGKLDLRGIPRNPANPGYFANFGLSPEDDAKLTAWMRMHLLLSTWVPSESIVLRDIERDVIMRWEPPLNLTHVATPWTLRVVQARRVMANQARAWRP